MSVSLVYYFNYSVFLKSRLNPNNPVHQSLLEEVSMLDKEVTAGHKTTDEAFAELREIEKKSG